MIHKNTEDTRVQEGEGVLFLVEVTGAPQPKLTWYHNGEEVVADYSKELAEDGSLTMPSAETKHSRVYHLVALNPAGEWRELTVEVEGGAEGDDPAYDEVAMSGVIPVDRFGSHVEQRHTKNSKPFKDEYEVRQIISNVHSHESVIPSDDRGSQMLGISPFP